MDLSASVLGSTVVAALTDRNRAPVLTIGRDTFTRDSLAGVHCFNFNAAAMLTRAIAELRPAVKDTAHLFAKVPPAALAVPGVGAVSLAVLGAAFEARGLGGDHPLESWVTAHDRDHPIVTFNTLKHRAADDAAPESGKGKQNGAVRKKQNRRVDR